MNKFIFVLALIVSPAAFAETLNCSFTEPFFSLNYDTATKVLTRTEPNWQSEQGELVTKVVARRVSVVRRSNKEAGVLASYARYKLVDRHGKALLYLTLNYQGSNGMADTVYPFHAEIPGATTSANNGIGGCESGSLQSIEPNQE